MSAPSRQSIKPLVSSRQVMLAVGADPGPNLRVAAEHGVGAEIQTFADPGVLASDYSKLLDKVVAKTKALKGPIGCHGAFFDTVHYSFDVEMMKLARMRYLQSFDFAEALNAKYVLFHSQYDPIIKVRRYADSYHDNSMRFWQEMVCESERRNIPIVIENMFDDSPEPIQRIAKSFDSPYFRVCLDVAHTVVWSKVPFSEWLDAFSPYLLVTHLTDCDGEWDEHLGLGDGSLDLAGYLKGLKALPQKLYYVLETHAYMKRSLSYLRIPKLER